MINRLKNLRKKVEIWILQKSPDFSILFLIYINGIYSTIQKILLDIIYVSFVDNLRFIISDCIINKIVKLLVKVRKIALEWDIDKVVIYNISKTKAVLFSKVWHQKLTRQLLQTSLMIRGKTVFFKQKATR